MGARRARGEDGASLLIALSFLLVFALLLTALLQFAVTSFKASNAVIDRERATYSADAAVNTAADRIKQDATMQIGRAGQACGPVTFTGADSTTPSATATCTPATNSGAAIPGVDGPANAILTQGGNLTLSGSGRLATNSNVFVNGAISVTGGAVLDAHDNAIAATGTCTPSPAGLPAFDAVKTYCNATAGSAPQFSDGADPNYNSRFNEVLTRGGRSVPPPNPKPSCSGNTATFSAPAVFTLSSALSGLCSGNASVLYFRPGAYYFDFQAFTGTAADYVWKIPSGSAVVGGPTSGSWSPGNALPAASDTGPTACTPGGGGQGVQFIFGGQSQIVMGANARLELCPLTSTPEGRVALYGAKAIPANLDFNMTMRPSSTCSSDFTPTANLLSSGPSVSPIDNTIASWTGTGNKGPDECLNGYAWSGAQAVQIPDGYTISSITARANHAEVGNVKPNGVTAVVSVVNASVLSNGKSSCTATFPTLSALPGAANPPTAACIGAMVGAITRVNGSGNDLAKALQVDWKVDYNGNAASSAQLDGVELDIDFTPLLHAENGCIVSGSCFLLSSDTASPHDTVAIGGTVYAVPASASLDFSGETAMHFDWGVILRALTVTGGPATDTTGRFRVGGGTGRTVTILSTSGNQRARAVVRVVDSASAHGFLAAVRQWSTAK